MTLTDCIPSDKFDDAAVERASALGYPGINPILPDLLIWLQDRNWPVAPDVARLLEWADVEIAPHIIAILNSDDGGWKYNVLLLIVGTLHNDVWQLIEADVARLAEAPTEDDRMEEVHIMAAEVLARRRSPKK